MAQDIDEERLFFGILKIEYLLQLVVDCIY